MSVSRASPSPAAARASRARSSVLTSGSLSSGESPTGLAVSKDEEDRMSLKEDLQSLRARAEAKRPPDVVAAMHRAVDELRASGAPARVVKSGTSAPHFALPDAEEKIVESVDLLARGPLVVTFYRGRW